MLYAFNLIITGSGDGNKEKVKPLEGTNKKVKGTIEYKAFKIRLYTLPVVENIVYLYLAIQKKCDTSRKIDMLLAKRCNEARIEVQELKDLLQDPEQKELILNENAETLKQILAKLELADKEETNTSKDALNNESNKQEASLDKHLAPATISKQPVVQTELKKQDQKWWDKYYHAKEYFEINGDLNIPTEYEVIDSQTSQIIKLGKWLSTQKSNYKNGSLRPDRLEALKEIGFLEIKTRENHRTVIEEEPKTPVAEIPVEDKEEQTFNEPTKETLSSKIAKLKEENEEIKRENNKKSQMIEEIKKLLQEREELLKRSRELDDRLFEIGQILSGPNIMENKRIK